MIDSILPEEIKKQIREIEEEFAPRAKNLKQEIEVLKKDINDAVLLAGRKAK